MGEREKKRLREGEGETGKAVGEEEVGARALEGGEGTLFPLFPPPSLSSTTPILTGHDFAVREVAREEVVVGGDVFVAHRVLLGDELHHPVD